MGETASARPPDTETCSNCGAEDWALEEFGRIRRLSGWLQQGRPAPRARLTCRNCGVELSTRDGSWAVLRQYRTSGWWGAPLRVIRVLLLARLAIPAPWIYLAAVATGALLGLALDVTIGWPWWARALGWVAGVWLLFLLTAFKGAGRSWELWLSLLDALDPKGASDRWNRRQEQVFRTAPFPLYGLPRTWRGPRSIGGGAWGGGGRYVTPTELELVHGDLEDAAGAVLRVTVPQSRRTNGSAAITSCDGSPRTSGGGRTGRRRISRQSDCTSGREIAIGRSSTERHPPPSCSTSRWTGEPSRSTGSRRARRGRQWGWSMTSRSCCGPGASRSRR